MITGDLVVDATQPFNVQPVTLPMDRSILFTSMRENESSPQYGSLICDLQAENTTAMTPEEIVCQRPAAGSDNTASDGTIHVRWTIVTFATGVTVQRGQANTGVTNPLTVSLASPADPSHSFVLIGGMISGGTGWGNNEFVQARLLDSQTLDVRTSVAGTRTAWQVVTMTGTSVQRGTTTLASTDTQGQVPVTAAAANSLVLLTYNTDNPSSLAASKLMLQASLTDSTTLAFKRGQGGPVIQLAWEIVTMPFFTRSFTTDLAIGEATKTQTITGLPAASSVAIASNQAVLGESSGSTDYDGVAVDLLGEAAATLTANDGNVTLERATTSSNASFTWTAIDFEHDRCDGL